MVKLKYKILGLLGIGVASAIGLKTLTSDDIMEEVEKLGPNLMKPIEQLLPKRDFKSFNLNMLSKTEMAKIAFSGPYSTFKLPSFSGTTTRTTSYSLPKISTKKVSSKVKLPW